MKKYLYIKAILIISLIGLVGCRKMIAVDSPVNLLTGDKVFTDSTATTALLLNTYALFNQTVDPTYTTSLGMYTDELSYTSTDINTTQFLQSNLSASNTAVLNIWKNNYFAIYECNDLIEGLNKYNGISVSTKNEYIAEAKFLRAYGYFYLTNTFGQVPLLLETDVNKTSVASRADTSVIYQQIIVDLKDAEAGLSENYKGDGKVRANKWAAAALLARVYLHQRRFADAEQTASSVINSGLYTPLQPPSSVFLANSKESILQLYDQYGYVAEANLIVPNGGTPTFPITNTLLNAFESGDLRKAAWLDTSSVVSGNSNTVYYFPYKYHNNSSVIGAPEYLVLLRAGEQYLIRAEARLQQKNISGAVEDINIIRQRAGLAPLSTSISSSLCMNALLQEWRIEFFSEWGHRFMDMKRLGIINQVLNAYKTTWQAKDVVLPIPQNELVSDPNLTQNSGY